MKILSLGSLNIDLVYSVDHINLEGETVSAKELETKQGGKGLNQSVALARAGADVLMAGCVGSDGKELLETLRDSGVDTALIHEVEEPSGHAVIQLADSGANSIIIYGGANLEITPKMIDEALDHFCPGDYILLQNEISNVDYAIRAAKTRGLNVAFNPSPISKELVTYPLELVDIFILNELEGQTLSGTDSTEGAAVLAALAGKFPKAAIVLTLGDRGAMYHGNGQDLTCPAHKVPVVDTTGAGDTFCGYFLACVMKGKPPQEALESASRARHNMLEQLSPQLWPGASAASPLHTAGKRIIVVGSMNMDVIVHLTHIPTSGESLQAQRFLNLPGGKGANQGVGTAKLGGNVYAIGCLGSDQEGRLLYSSLVENGVNTAGVRIVHDKPTGKAYILVAENGESTIVRSYGANNDLQPDVVKAGAAYFEDAQFCLISMEMPWETVLYTIDFCLERGIQTIVKPTTPRVIPAEVLKKITFLVPNEKELEVQISGSQPVEEKAASLFVSGAQNVIVTLGEKGCYLHNKELKRHFPAADFQAVDTTGAGDAFISALAVFLSEGHNIISSI